MTRFGWDYPPGVSGREPQIAGYPEDAEPCGFCGHEAMTHMGTGGLCGHRGCECVEYEEPWEEHDDDGPDPDRDRDR